MIAARIVTVGPICGPYYFGPAARTFLYKRITKLTTQLAEEKRQPFLGGKTLQAAGWPTRRGFSLLGPEFSPLDRIASLGLIIRRHARFLCEPICPTARGPLAGSPSRCRRSTAPRRELPPILSSSLVTANSIQACGRTQRPSSRPVRRFYRSKAAFISPFCSCKTVRIGDRPVAFLSRRDQESATTPADVDRGPIARSQSISLRRMPSEAALGRRPHLTLPGWSVLSAGNMNVNFADP